MALRLSSPQSISHGREGVGAEPLVGVDRRVEQGASAGACARTPAIGVRGRRRTARARRRGRRRRSCPSSSTRDTCRWKPAAALVVERLGHEGRQHALRGGRSPGRRTSAGTRGRRRRRSSEWSRLISNWPRAELVVRGGHPQAGVAQVAQHRQQQAARVALAARRRRRCRARRRTAASRPCGVLLADEELELGADDGGEAELGEPLRHPAGHLARRLRAPARRPRPGVAEAPGRAGLPRQRRERRQVGRDA